MCVWLIQRMRGLHQEFTHQERHGEEEHQPQQRQLQAPALTRQRQHDAQQQDPEHVIRDGGAHDHDPRFAAQPADLVQHLHRHTDAGGRERGGQEHAGVEVHLQQRPDRHAGREG